MSAAARLRYTLVAGVTAVVIGAGFAAVGISKQADAGSTVPSAADQPLPGSSLPEVTDEPLVDLGSPSPSVSVTPSPSPSVSKTASAKPSPSRTSRSARASRTPTAAPTAPRTGDAILDAVLARINEARVEEGLGILTLDANLSKAAALHTQLMIDGCGLEHQCPGESGLGARFTAAGVTWRAAGENIGFGSSGASDAQIIRAANGLTDSMLAEVPPNDGHRKNLLSTTFKRIGLSVVRDGNGRTWMTQDFVN
ncbi:CAP domain-containing protein [Paractinoplanes rishiriensis]|uniref:SCP domain-containing protein n=1 Tax=Paractinoplanes rishiriensis TaxID=1050105 RepID=A0A919MYI2_9ACTN|nr:CAP domain-containing protein [Actinoplanes rishiriensis]GIE92542.1 hypothetical protein Ari01nite_00070 [Actinoplanes rishiriensis]